MKSRFIHSILLIAALSFSFSSCISTPPSTRNNSKTSEKMAQAEDSKDDTEPVEQSKNGEQSSDGPNKTSSTEKTGKNTGNLLITTETAGTLIVNNDESYPLAKDGSILLNGIRTGHYTLKMRYTETSIEQKETEVTGAETTRIAFTWKKPEREPQQTTVEKGEEKPAPVSENEIRTVNLLGGKYVGRLKNGKSHGWGTLYLNNGDKYEGEWKQGEKEGFGSYLWKNGDVYKGEWESNKREGTGTYLMKNGDKYTGSWENDTMHGYGVYVWANGDRYEGHWKYGKKAGKGTFQSSGGDTYDGEWQNDAMHGTGTFIWADGDRYTGEWNNGVMHGEGTFSLAYRGRYEGRFRNGKAVGGYYYLSDGTKRWAYMDENGKWQFEEADDKEAQ